MSILEGTRVLDFGRYIAGPFCGMLLADLGADVIRVEKVDGSEDRFTAPVTPDGQGSLFLALNRNKRGFTLNPRKPEGQDVLRRLVATRRRGHRQPAAGHGGVHGARLREPDPGEAGHRAHHQHRVRVGWAVCEPRRVSTALPRRCPATCT